MASILVTGASRGIGLELTKQLLDLPESQVKRVFALSRNSSSAALQALIEQHAGRAVQLFASLDDSESVRKAASELARCLDGQGLDILVNMAGTNSQDLYGLPLAKIAPEELERVLDVNVTGVHRTTAAMYPLLEAGKHKKVIYMSTQVGSIAIADRYKAVPQMPYKVSKAALNMLNAQYALENADKGFTFLCISPGWLKTELGGSMAPLNVDVGVAEVRRIIFESTPADNGKFLNIKVSGFADPPYEYTGGEIPW